MAPPQPQKIDLHEQAKLDKVASRSNRILFHTKTNFPFDLFPDELTIDENQVNINHKRFFYTQDVESLPISEIKEVSLSTSIVFSSLTISVLRPGGVPIKLDFLWPHDAETARSLIQGLTILQNENIDLSKIDTKVLKDRLLNITHKTK